ncbi:FIST N-terminal domain-containing protein [Salinivibrio socompensis]|uniref:FIST N-terminal domain-containing protein n=1 Tax=Salinivibrio socompensis TaxID=1510206 RepID=UPI0004B02D6F
MKIATARTQADDAVQAAYTLARIIKARISTPKLLMIYFTEHYDVRMLQRTLNSLFPGVPLIGCSTCYGVMTQSGCISGPAAAIWACSDDKGSYVHH